MSTPFEEARQCPKCGMSGKEGTKRPCSEPPSSFLLDFECRNKGCKWFSSAWTVQIMPDGTIPDPQTNREKSFPKIEFSPDQAGRYDRYFEQLQREQFSS